ncbi:uncharacterized protein A1O5_12365 [Cladophialophora psammophila CBS 110553]|uniref:Major facilitator superfamily (MFS) profile domain-containing protein n=1 Tax=Cladophialophora psammophila CBS 110553 TaxID=1182543 RepID=W9VQ06_9EURO|nr:uncharacterized protein A1O5_12365 [Cladophialophora psammophila CBS 110553]EXJ57807.1 hypothetical protein A1O5_12365 [Cladophialophora psammophila CBS 110553]
MSESLNEERPGHDVADWTRQGIYITIGVSLVVALGSIGLSVATFAGQLVYTGLSSSSIIGELLPLAFNIVVAILTDILSFAHSVSLRRVLYKENRLEYNSNLRLFTSTKRCNSNRWPANLMSAILLVTSYTAANAALYVYKEQNGAKNISLNAVAFMALGISLIGQIIIAIWSLYGADDWVHSWSANPLNTALPFLNKGVRYRVLGRGMMSVRDILAQTPAGPKRPQERQQNMIKGYPHVGYMLWIVGAALAPDLLFAAIVCRLTFQQHLSAQLAFLVQDGMYSFFSFAMLYEWSPYVILLVTFVLGIALQACITLTLHCAELVVNVSRDEEFWRRAYIATGKGAKINASPVISALSNWSWVILFIIKPIAQWLFGTASMSLGQRGEGDGVVWFNSVPLFVLGGPATFGHIEALANLIDDWGGDIKGRIYWGEKSSVTPVWGKAADVWDRKPPLLSSIALFAIGSAICGWPKDLVQLISGRAVQGSAAGGIIVLVNIWMSDVWDARTLDWIGTVAIIGVTVMILLSLDFGGVFSPWDSPKVLSLLICGFVLLTFLVFWKARGASNPLVLSHLLDCTSKVSPLMVSFTHGFVRTHQPPVFSSASADQHVLIMPIVVVQAITGLVAGAITYRFDWIRPLIWAGMALTTLGFGLFIGIGTSTSLVLTVIIEIVVALRIGITFQAPLLAYQSIVGSAYTVVATALFGLVRSLSTSISIVIGGIVFQNSMSTQSKHLSSILGAQLAQNFSATTAATNALTIRTLPFYQQTEVKNAYASSLKHMWIMYASTGGLGLIAALFVKTQAPGQASSEPSERDGVELVQAGSQPAS